MKQVRTVTITYENDPDYEELDWWNVFDQRSQYSKVLAVKVTTQPTQPTER